LFANPGAVTYQWYYNGNSIPGATEYFYVAAQSGNYNVVATDNNDCEVEAAIFDVIASILQTGPAGQELFIFPNPVKDVLEIKIPVRSPGRATVEVYNLPGEKVHSGNFPGSMAFDLNVSELPPGIYILRVLQGDHRFYARFVKQ
jgi:hypothetical protein